MGELTLTGRHLEDWQLAFQGCGEIHLPCNGGATARAGSKATTQTRVNIYTQGGQSYLSAQDFTRTESFGQCAGEIFYCWGDWQAVGSPTSVAVGGAPVGSYQVSIKTLPGSPAPGCHSHWCDLTLHLVQVPIGCAGNVTGYKLI